MQLHLYRHLWGVTEPLAKVLPKIKARGYVGVEVGLGQVPDKKHLYDLLQEHDLKLIACIYTDGQSVDEHLHSFRVQIEEAQEFSAAMGNSHSGADRFSLEESLKFFQGATELEHEAGFSVAHETHRGRIFFNPWTTQRILREFPMIAICADFSHWVCIAERLFQTEGAIMDLAARHAIHIHARVGYEQGPQVPDPRVQEYAVQLQAHEQWWELIWKSQRQRGLKISTLTPEFGPPPYLHTLPGTEQPVADLWEICEWQADRQRDRFSRT
jgi:sugar phosphate isomerase/epimerase